MGKITGVLVAIRGLVFSLIKNSPESHFPFPSPNGIEVPGLKKKALQKASEAQTHTHTHTRKHTELTHTRTNTYQGSIFTFN